MTLDDDQPTQQTNYRIVFLCTSLHTKDRITFTHVYASTLHGNMPREPWRCTFRLRHSPRPRLRIRMCNSDEHHPYMRVLWQR